MDRPAQGLRERRKHSTRAALQDAALRLFARDGFDATSIEAIAEEAEVSPRTFFRYFASKDEVLNPDRLARQDHLREAVLACDPASTPSQAAQEALLALAAEFEADRHTLLLQRRAAATSPALRGRLLDVTVSWQHALAQALADRGGRRRPTLADQVAAATALAAWQVAISRWLDTPTGRRGLASGLRAAFASAQDQPGTA